MAIDWNDLIREHGSTVFGAAWRILGQTADADDVVQEVFLEAQQLSNGQTVRQWGGLLRRMATYRALDRLRRRRQTVSIDDVVPVGREHDPESIAIGHELETRLRDAITRLSEQEAAVFCLRCFEDLSYEQIADSLSISAQGVATALFKARTKLKQWLAESEKGD